MAKFLKITGSIVAFFVLFFAVGFIYGTVRAKYRTSDDLVKHLTLERNYRDNNMYLVLNCPGSPRIYSFDINNKQTVGNTIAMYNALHSVQQNLSEFLPNETKEVFQFGALILGVENIWKMFKAGKASSLQKVIIAVGATTGFPVGYIAATDWLEMNCASSELFKKLDKPEYWQKVGDDYFIRSWATLDSYCGIDRAKWATIRRKLSRGDAVWEHMDSEDYKNLETRIEECK